jgi:1-acyl-sn-glycerol-3-phosphate acyltransferase
LRRPGKVLVEFLDPIEPGLQKEEFFSLLRDRLEAATARLIDESLANDPTLGASQRAANAAVGPGV